MTQLKTYIFIVLSFIIINGCEKSNDKPQEEFEHGILIYIGANNNLHYDAINTIEKIREGAKSLKKDQAIVVYAKTQSISTLLKITRSDNGVKIDTLKNFSSENSSNPNFLKGVVEITRNSVRAKKYGLVLWSHATSWIPPTNSKTKSFGSDDFQEMDIKDLKSALPGKWEYIMFDACSMASIEVCYELKDIAKFILGSPAEVLSTSFPYDVILMDLFKGEEGLVRVCSKFMEYYRKQTGLYASATVSLIETSQLSDIALHTQRLLQMKKPVEDFNRSKIQSLDFDNIGDVPAYDFISFLKQNFEESEYGELVHSIEKSILFKDHTSEFFNFPIKEYCGLSIYLPEKNDPYLNYYKTLLWSGDSKWHQLF